MVNQLLELHYYNGEFAIPTVTPNRTIKPSELSKLPIYAKWQLMPTNSRMSTLSSVEQTGLLQIALFVDVAIGTDLIDQKAQAIVNHFGIEQAHDVSGQNLMIMSSTANAAMPDGFGKYMMPITIEYRLDRKAVAPPYIMRRLARAIEKLVNEDLPSALGSIA